jgi:hypothetical protein
MSKCDLFRPALTAALFIATSVLVSAQDGLQFNVPYVCNDGATYVVHKCEKGPKFEACFYQAEGESERYNTREAVVYQMTKLCKIKASSSSNAATPQPSSDLQNSRWECGDGTTLTVTQCQKQSGQDYCFVKLFAVSTNLAELRG